MYLLNIIIIVVFSARSFASPTLNLPHSETSEYKGEISCNSEINISIKKSQSESTNITKFDIWKLSIDDSECINIFTNINTTLYDCNGVLIDSSQSNDYLASTICEFKYFIQLKRFYELDKYKLKVFCSNGDNTQCDKTMRRLKSGENRVEIGYLRQLISIDNSESDSSDSSDSKTQNPTQNPSKFPTYGVIPEFRICFQETEGSSQCLGIRSSCSEWSYTASIEDISTWTASFRDDTDGRSGGCKYQWMIQQRDSVLTYQHHSPYKYRLCFKELEGSSQCQGSRDTCSGWNDNENWTNWFRDDTDDRSGGCNYRWMIHQIEDTFAIEINECRVCFQEIEGSSQCQGTRYTCSGWSKTSLGWTASFRDDTDGRSGGCKYQWKLQCQ